MGFSADIIADSINENSNRVTTFILTYPRFIHAEFMTHRAFSRNASSSRAIPISKIIEQVKKDPATPIRWGKNGKGMQDHGKVEDQESCRDSWIFAANKSIESANLLESKGLHKQIVNRVLEPFVWMTTLVTATEWENFFSLRLHKDAQPEIQNLALIMIKEYLNSVPENKKWNEWHIPFGDRLPNGTSNDVRLKIATARAARVSYVSMNGEIDIEKDISLHDGLALSGHWSPFEHACYASKEYRGNLVGWQQYRHTFPNENRKCNLTELLSNYENSLKE